MEVSPTFSKRDAIIKDLLSSDSSEEEEEAGKRTRKREGGS
jgi:hypothetical protein